MSFLDSIFGSSTPSEEGVWNQLSQEERVEEVFLASNNSPQIILKHSNSCGTSYFAKKNLESITKEELQDSELHLIDVIRSRAVSNYLADKAGVRHESPQVFVIKNGEVVWHASHGMVTADNVLAAI
ncbi:MAG: bacillithiol system redox-active protein YtxJ [Balneolaceae bacterium]|nr:bacillithiol system redox-active protein YtxJ [Balneolaceae bacterium]MBO6546831.1 bacillithiol system redox-active protein YtxJ [Balneolaceae bacterium]MBO6649191.1 bacillithiol system redox-active protein YtxJ [Balneolaceae bacterium]